MRKLSLVLASLMVAAFTFATMPAKAGSHAVAVSYTHLTLPTKA